ncbi:hypothetical protein EDB86DRAFT_2881824 [Lactarius hatsudake]|nr:hypothetical protein EDB86DRAFT_2881824 [Lactarius hatsudake]
MRQPIILWQNERTLSTDDAGVTILSSVSPPRTYFQPGPYYDEDPLSHVPSLSYFCIKHLVKIPEMVYNYGPARPYRPPEYPESPDILRTLPRTPQCNVDLSKVDPRLWAVIVQVYSDLPSDLHIYRTALADKYLPSLQRIPTTEHFSLLTVLEIPGCSHLTDDTIVRLAVIHTLCVLDASNTPLTAQGIRRLSGTLRWGDDGVDTANQRRGPWQLRILSLRNCKQSFILLAVVPSSFFPANEKQLYHPTTPLEALSLLTSSPGLLPSSNTALLHIDHLTHPTPEHRRDRGKFLVHPDSMTRDHVGFKYEFNAFWLSNTGPLKTQSHRQIPQWGQELLMLYREPPPWSKVHDPPIVKGPPKTRSSNELAAVRRTDEQAMKSLQRLQDMLSERHRNAGTEVDSSCGGLKVSAKYSAPRNPFAKSHSGGSSGNVSERADEKSRAFLPHTHKSIMEVPPKSLRSLKPITSLPVPRPPNSVKQASANKGRDAQRVLPRPQLSHESSQKRVSVSLHIDDSEGQKAEMIVASTGTRCASGRADPAVGRKRHRTATPATGSKM